MKSNGIIIVKNLQLIGVGAGQASRIDSVELAIRKSQSPVAGAVLLSDAFFPFPDSIELAAKHKIAVVVETGGSVRDPDVILAAQKLGRHPAVHRHPPLPPLMRPRRLTARRFIDKKPRSGIFHPWSRQAT